MRMDSTVRNSTDLEFCLEFAEYFDMKRGDVVNEENSNLNTWTETYRYISGRIMPWRKPVACE